MSSHPPTRRDDLVEDHFGTAVADPYRWLEDADAPQVAAWVAAQRAHTDAELERLPERAWFARTMRAIVSRRRAGGPHHAGGRWFLSRNDGEQAQDVWYTAATLDELLAGEGRVIIDPNRWSADGADSLGAFTVSDDGALVAYSVSEAGSDWRRIRLLDWATGAGVDVPDVVGKFTVPTWLPDCRSYLYLTFDEATDARGTATAGLGAPRWMLHRLDGGPDEVVLSFPDDPRTMVGGRVSHDGAWLVASIVRGTENRNRLWAFPLATAAGRTELGEPLRIIDEPDAEYEFVRVAGDTLLLRTDLDAPRGRVVAVRLAEPAGRPEFTTVIAEAADTLASVTAAGDELLAEYLVDAVSRVRRHSVDGAGLGELDLPAGAVVAVDGDADHPEAFVGVSTLVAPTAAFRVDGGAVRALDLVPAGTSVAPPHTVGRRRAPSRDGTPVPYFLVLPEGLPPGPRPTLLYGYGGFKVPVLPDYRPGWGAWLAAGGVLAIANLRGGGEFGTDWYDAGRGAHKQNVFDDLIGVAEHLVATGVCTPAQLAVHGRSNGGLLVGAVMTQRPELFGAALPTVGVLDLLRFHRFTIGAAWMSDYGDPDTPEGFAAAHAYSPLHNLRPGVAYPPTLVCTADHDDRVVPLHSFKFGAALQHAQGGPAPVLLRIEGAAGHGAGKPLHAIADEWADVLAFAAHHTGLVTPGR